MLQHKEAMSHPLLYIGNSHAQLFLMIFNLVIVSHISTVTAYVGLIWKTDLQIIFSRLA